MAVNDELPNLDALLRQAPQHLTRGGGRFGVISFHSGEDRRIKQAFRSAEQTGEPLGTFSILTKKPVTPADDEIARNPRARSAKLRVIEKT
jgi:16S rRNA (cytosine1402-N4)-methyltransferase